METTNNNKSVAVLKDYRPAKEKKQEYKAPKNEEEKTSFLDLSASGEGILSYYTTKTATWIQKRDREGNWYDKKLSDQQIIILSLISDGHCQYISLKIVLREADENQDGDAHIISMPVSALLSLSKENEKNQAFHLAGGDARKEVGDILFKVQAKAFSLGLIEKIKGSQKPGWHNGEHLRAGDKLCTLSHNTSPRSVMGDFDVWKDSVHTVIEGQIKAQAILCLAAGAYLRGRDGFTIANNNIINLVGETSSGKSTVLQIIQSFEDCPIQLAEASSTMSATEKLLVAHNGGFLCFDELTSLTEDIRNPIVRLINLCNFSARNINAGGNAKGRSWNTTIFTSSNKSLDDIGESNHFQREALNARCFEYAFPIFTQNDIHSRAFDCFEVIQKNHGVAYPRIIAAIKNLDADGMLSEKYLAFVRQCNDAARNSLIKMPGGYTRKSQACGLGYIGSIILKEIGLNIDIDGVGDELIDVLERDINIADEKEKNGDSHLKADIFSIIYQIFRYTTVKKFYAPDDSYLFGSNGTTSTSKQKEAAIEHSKTVIEEWCTVEQKEEMKEAKLFTGFVYFKSTMSAEIKKRTGFDMSDIITKADKAGALVISDADRARGAKVYKHGRLSWCYKINLSALPDNSDGDGDGEIETLEENEFDKN